jgi:hypothetical protein
VGIAHGLFVCQVITTDEEINDEMSITYDFCKEKRHDTASSKWQSAFSYRLTVIGDW